MLGRALRVRNGADPFNETNRLFDEFLRGWGTALAPYQGSEQGLSVFTPSLDISEDDKEYRVTAELPGLDEKNVDVSISGDVLTIKGEKTAEHEEQGKHYFRSERSYGAFHRSIALSGDVDRSKVDASFKKGILTVRLPKTTETQQLVKKIDVKGS